MAGQQGVLHSDLFLCGTMKANQADTDAGLSSARSRSIEPIPRFTADELRLLLGRVKEQAKLCDNALLEEEEKRQTYRVDDARRVHNYEPFIRAYLTALSKHGFLKALLVQALQNVPNLAPSLSFLGSVGSTSSARKSSGTLDPLHHSRKSDSDRSGSKDSPSPMEAAAESSPWISSRRLSVAERHSTPMSADGGPTRRALRARNKRGTFMSMYNALPQNRNDSLASRAINHLVQNQLVSSSGFVDAENSLTVVSVSEMQTPGTISDSLNSVDLQGPGRTSVIDTESAVSMGSQSSKSKSQTVSPVPPDPTGNETTDVNELSGVLQAPLSPLASSVAQTPYSSCGSAPQSPQSSTSSRSTYLRPLRQNPRNDPVAIEDGFISRKSLRPRSSTDRITSRSGCQLGLGDSGDELKSENGHKLFLRRRAYSSLVKHIDSSGACKPGPTTNPFSTAFSQRFRKRRLC